MLYEKFYYGLMKCKLVNRAHVSEMLTRILYVPLNAANIYKVAVYRQYNGVKQYNQYRNIEKK